MIVILAGESELKLSRAKEISQAQLWQETSDILTDRRCHAQTGRGSLTQPRTMKLGFFLPWHGLTRVMVWHADSLAVSATEAGSL